jgi:hypothetical protein
VKRRGAFHKFCEEIKRVIVRESFFSLPFADFKWGDPRKDVVRITVYCSKKMLNDMKEEVTMPCHGKGGKRGGKKGGKR